MCEINQYIKKDTMPKDSVDIDNLNSTYKLKLEPEKGSRYYYDKLMQMGEDKKNQMKNDFGEPMDMELTWEEFGKLTDTEKELVRKQVEYKLKEIAEEVQKSRGIVPSELAEMIADLFKPIESKLDWKAQLRRFTGSCSEIITKSSRKKFNKRFPGNPALRFKPKKHIACIIDTSGSMNTKELYEGLNEFYHMKKAGALVTILECDAALQRVYKMKNVPDVQVHGRGGEMCATLYSNI